MTDSRSGLMIVAAAVLVNPDRRVLLQQRPAGKELAGLWEFPGGKLEAGESPEAALVRELAEELAIAVAPEELEPLAFSTGNAGGRALLLLLYLARRWTGEPQPQAAAELRWVAPVDITLLPMPPADLPLVAALARTLA